VTDNVNFAVMILDAFLFRGSIIIFIGNSGHSVVGATAPISEISDIDLEIESSLEIKSSNHWVSLPA